MPLLVRNLRTSHKTLSMGLGRKINTPSTSNGLGGSTGTIKIITIEEVVLSIVDDKNKVDTLKTYKYNIASNIIDAYDKPEVMVDWNQDCTVSVNISDHWDLADPTIPNVYKALITITISCVDKDNKNIAGQVLAHYNSIKTNTSDLYNFYLEI